MIRQRNLTKNSWVINCVLTAWKRGIVGPNARSRAYRGLVRLREMGILSRDQFLKQAEYLDRMKKGD